MLSGVTGIVKSDEDIETLDNGIKIKFLKEKATPIVTDEIVKSIWNDIDSFNEDGGYYFVGDMAYIGVKDEAKIEELKKLNDEKGMPSNIKIEKAKYSFNELESIKSEVNKELENMNLNPYSVEAKVKTQNVIIEIPMIEEEKRTALEEKFGEKINIVTHYNHKEVEAKEFIDVQEGSWYKEAIEHLQKKGIINGGVDGKFFPEDNIMRQDAVSMAYRTIGAVSIYKKIPEMTKIFSDQSEVAQYADRPIKYFETTGGISGYPDGSIHPKDNITRGEAIVFLSKAFAYKLDENVEEDILIFRDVSEEAYYKKQLEIMVNSDIVKQNDSEFRADENITRAEFATFLYRLIK